MDLNELLAVMDSTAANLAKLDEVWARAHPLIPIGPARGSSREYDQLCRDWDGLLPGLPLIDEWTVTSKLPDIDDIGATYANYWELGEPDFEVAEEAEQPGKDLAEYRYRLNRVRRRAARDRLQTLEAIIDTRLSQLLPGVDRYSTDVLKTAETDEITHAVEEIERLMSDATTRQGRWGDLHRHLAFSQGHDWNDIGKMDWPSVKVDIEAACFSETDPLPVPDIDLGDVAGRHPTGAATTALAWAQISEGGFERLLYDLFKSLSRHQNVQWLTRTNAADRGRDLSLERILDDGTGSVRNERVIVQAKHWLSRSVNLPDIIANLAALKLWEPPTVRVLIVATSGRFTADAVAWVEKHNDGANVPMIELWPESKLENLLAQKPHLVAAHNLR